MEFRNFDFFYIAHKKSVSGHQLTKSVRVYFFECNFPAYSTALLCKVFQILNLGLRYECNHVGGKGMKLLSHVCVSRCTQSWFKATSNLSCFMLSAGIKAFFVVLKQELMGPEKHGRPGCFLMSFLWYDTNCRNVHPSLSGKGTQLARSKMICLSVHVPLVWHVTLTRMWLVLPWVSKSFFSPHSLTQNLPYLVSSYFLWEPFREDLSTNLNISE